jgi:hypothetical protein
LTGFDIGEEIIMERAQDQGARRQQLRRDLIHQYLHLQRQLLEAEPSSSTYQATMHAFRRMGYTLITSGFEDDLDRLLRIRVLDGGKTHRGEPHESSFPQDLHVIEQVPIH